MIPRFDKLLVLDIDETLIYASMFPLKRASDFQIGLSAAYKRPGLARFMKTCLDWFKVGIWTSATPEYTGDVLFHLVNDPALLAFIWTREHCTSEEDPASGDHYWGKDLGRLIGQGYRAESIMIVDDSIEVWGRYSAHVVSVAKYRGDPTDDELEKLIPYLEQLGDIRNAL